MVMNIWTQIQDRIWYYLEEGPKSSALVAAFPKANRYRYDETTREADPPTSAGEPVLIVDQTGGEIDLNYSPRYLKLTEHYHLTVWTASLSLVRINDLRLKVLAAMDAGLPDLGLDDVLDVKMNTGRLCLAPDKIERDADGRLMPWRRDLQKQRQRAVLLELVVTFLMDRDTL
jgi:hypothetical protein